MKLRMSRIVWSRLSIARSTRRRASSGSSSISLGHVVQREADGVDRLDHAVVEILPDPLALLDDGQPLDLLVEPGILHGDRRRGGRRSRPVRWSSSVNTPSFSVRYRLPMVRPRETTGTPRKGCISGWLGGKPTPRGSAIRSAQPDRPVLADDQAQDAVTPRRRADAGTVGTGEPARDELLDDTGVVHDAEGRVARPGQGADLVDDHLQDAVRREHAGHRPDRFVERLEPLGRHRSPPLGSGRRREPAPPLAPAGRSAAWVRRARACRWAPAHRSGPGPKGGVKGDLDRAAPGASAGPASEGAPPAVDGSQRVGRRLEVDPPAPQARRGLQPGGQHAPGASWLRRPGVEGDQRVQQVTGVAGGVLRAGHRRERSRGRRRACPRDDTCAHANGRDGRPGPIGPNVTPSTGPLRVPSRPMDTSTPQGTLLPSQPDPETTEPAGCSTPP